MSNNTEVSIIEQLGSNGMESTAARKLLDEFGVPWTRAGELIEKGRAIEVTSEDDTDGMAQAKAIGKELQQERIAIEKRHDVLKADSLAYGKAVDLVQRIALEQIKPVEEHLKLQAKFAEVQQEKRRQEVTTKRTAELAKYVDDVSIYNYSDMGDDAFVLLLDQVKAAKETADKLAADEAAAIEKARVEKEEADRIAREKAEAELAAEREINAKKLARISKLSELGFSFTGNTGYMLDNITVQEATINNATDEAWDSFIETTTVTVAARKEEQAKAAATEAERVKKIEEQAAVDRQAAEKAAAEKKAADDAEAKRIADEKAAADAAAAAPDKEKLLTYVSSIESLVIIGVSSEKGKKIAARIEAHHAQAVAAYKKLINEEL